MSTANVMINLDQTTTFKMLQGVTFTVPDTVDVQSPTGASSGVSPTTTFNSKRPVMGGQIIAAFNDQAVTTQPDLAYKLAAGDVVVTSAVASNVVTVTVNGVLAFNITNVTTTAIVFGIYG